MYLYGNGVMYKAREIAKLFEEESLVFFSKRCAELYSDYDEFTADEVMDLVRKIIKGEIVVDDTEEEDDEEC